MPCGYEDSSVPAYGWTIFGLSIIIDGPLACFPLLFPPFAVNIHAQVCVWTCVFISFFAFGGINRGVELLGQAGSLGLTEELLGCFPECLHHFTFPFSFFLKNLLEVEMSLQALYPSPKPGDLFLDAVKSMFGETPNFSSTPSVRGAGPAQFRPLQVALPAFLPLPTECDSSFLHGGVHLVSLCPPTSQVREVLCSLYPQPLALGRYLVDKQSFRVGGCPHAAGSGRSGEVGGAPRRFSEQRVTSSPALCVSGLWKKRRCRASWSPSTLSFSERVDGRGGRP